MTWGREEEGFGWLIRLAENMRSLAGTSQAKHAIYPLGLYLCPHLVLSTPAFVSWLVMIVRERSTLEETCLPGLSRRLRDEKIISFSCHPEWL